MMQGIVEKLLTASSQIAVEQPPCTALDKETFSESSARSSGNPGFQTDYKNPPKTDFSG